MKLLIINYEFPPLGGGGGRASAHIAREMALLGHEVTVVTSSFRGLPREKMISGYRVLRIPTLRRHLEKCRIHEMVCFMLSSLIQIPWIARKYKFQACISFFTIPSAPAAWILRKLFGIPYIVSLRGGDVPGFMHEQLWLYHKILLPIIRRLWRSAHAVVANSEGLKDMARKSDAVTHITIIPNGVDSRFFHENAVDMLAQHSQTVPKRIYERGEDQQTTPFRLLTVGRLSPQKGLPTLIEAFYKASQQTNSPLELWVIGDGPERSRLEKLVKSLDLEAYVIFLGWQEQSDLYRYYLQADLFVLASLYEGMPNVILEAMASGLPIVSTRVEGSSELVHPGINGLLVPPKDVIALTEALATLIPQHDLLRSMSAASLEISRNYRWEKVAKGYLELCAPQT